MPCVRIFKIFQDGGSWFLTLSTSWNGLCNLWSLTAFKAVWPFKLLQSFTIDCEICEVKLSSLAGDQGSGWSRTKVVLLFLASFLIRYISGEGGTSWTPPQFHPFLVLTLSIAEMTEKGNVPHIINVFFKQERTISTINWSDLIFLSIST